jgi:uncharacterized protein (DUF2252 family)
MVSTTAGAQSHRPAAAKDSAQRGRAARRQVPRQQLAAWDESSRGHDALQTILAQNTIRGPHLVPIRHGRMVASPWTYFRGAAAVMAADLASTPHTGIGVQLCGDAHVLNFGLWATPERNLSFDLRDFDETLPGPFEWDVKRLAASLVVLARDNGVAERKAVEAVQEASRSYRARMAAYASLPEIDIWYDQIDVHQLLDYFRPVVSRRASKLIESKSQKRTSRGASRKLTEIVGGHRRITEEPPFRTHLSAAKLGMLNAVLHDYRASLPDHTWDLLSRFEARDAVRQVVGVGSVGMRVFLTLFEERRTDDPLFLQVKQAGPSVFEKFLEPSRYANHGARVVQGQKMLQSATDLFAGWTRVNGRDFYVRQFRDMKVIPDGAMIGPHLEEFAAACGAVLARAHARSGDAAAIDGYLGSTEKVDDALAAFAVAYADQNERDHAQLAAAVASGAVPSVPGW